MRAAVATALMLLMPVALFSTCIVLGECVTLSTPPSVAACGGPGQTVTCVGAIMRDGLAQLHTSSPINCDQIVRDGLTGQ